MILIVNTYYDITLFCFSNKIMYQLLAAIEINWFLKITRQTIDRE